MSVSSPLGGLARRLCPRCTRSLPLLRRNLSSANTPPLKLAIIGAGPSGFYTASRVLSSLPPDSPSGQDVEVHMYERLPTPYGLVRYGVAPDHPEVKNCQHKFDELAKDPRFKYFGNVLVTSQPSIPSADISPPPTALSAYTYPHAVALPLNSLVHHYNALLLSYGASLSNPLSSVSGSSSSPTPLANVFPALALVGWYNGHPAFADLPVDLKGVEEVAVVGQGNVALDVARILLKSAEDLAGTDIPDDILHVLSRSDVRNVRAVGRRGPAQVAFTTKELREIVSIPDVGFEGLKGEMMEEAKELVKGDRMRTRILGLMEKDNKYLDGRKRFTLDFLRSPTAFLADGEGMEKVEWAVNALSTGSGGIVAKATGEKVVTRADMVVESVGYRSEPLGPIEDGGWSLPFDRTKGRVKNEGGRVVGEDGVAVSPDLGRAEQIPGIYAAGWVARGPIGVIASTMHDAYTVADELLTDHHAPGSAESPLPRVPEAGVPPDLARGLKEGRVVDLEKWALIDAAERERGRTRGKEREKFRRVEEMLAVLS